MAGIPLHSPEADWPPTPPKKKADNNNTQLQSWLAHLPPSPPWKLTRLHSPQKTTHTPEADSPPFPAEDNAHTRKLLNPAVIDVYAWTDDVDSLKHAPVLLQNQADQSHGLPDLLGPRKMPVHGTRGTTGSEDCLLLYSGTGNSLILPIALFTCQI